MRKVPVVAFVARYYCPEQHTTFGLLPDFYASRVPGTLDDIERTAAQAEVSAGLEHAAEELRPADDPCAVTLSAAVAWVRRRVAWVRALLLTVAGLFPDLFAGVGESIRAFREHLGTSRVLVALRGILRAAPVRAAPASRAQPPGAVAPNARRRAPTIDQAGPPAGPPVALGQAPSSEGLPRRITMNDPRSARERRAEEIALFRYGLISDLVRPADGDASPRHALRAAAREGSPIVLHPWHPPDARRRRDAARLAGPLPRGRLRRAQAHAAQGHRLGALHPSGRARYAHRDEGQAPRLFRVAGHR